MTKKEFNKEKARLNSSIAYHTKAYNNAEVLKLSVEYCNLYIKNGVVPRSDFRYIDLYNKLVNMQIDPETEEIVEKEDPIKSLFTTPEIRSIRKLMSNYNIQFEEKCNIITERHGITKEAFLELLEELGIPVGATQFEKARFNELRRSKRYIISSAQSGSPVNDTFYINMMKYAEFINAEVGIIATRYRNPTSNFVVETDVWDSMLEGQLTAVRQTLHKNLSLVADLKIQATSPNPTNGLDAFEGHKSIIVGSPTVESRPVSVLPTDTQKSIYSTGTVTVPNFTDSVAGGKAEDLHNYGFVVVEIENDDVVHVRNVIANVDGSFNDLIYRVEDGEITQEDTQTLVWGDSHFAQKDFRVTEAFRNLCEDLGVSHSVLHDVWDSESINVHNVKDPIVQHQLMKEGRDDLQKELDQMIDELEWFSENMLKTTVVYSNHDDMLDRAMVQSDWRDNLKNAEVFVRLLSLKLSGKADDGIIHYLINQHFDNITALGVEDSYIENGVELALHGHKGPNGSRGNIKSFGRLTTPNIIGHSHAPGIKWNTFQVGVSCGLKHGYNKGLSNWGYAGVTLNKHGARQLIVFNKDTLTYTTLY